MAAARKPQRKSAPKSAGAARRILARAPLAEWIAAGLGLVLTLAVLGVSLWEAGTGSSDAPVLTLEAGTPAAAGGGFVMPLTLRNDSSATAASVWIRGTLLRDGEPVESRRAMIDYAPGKGEVRAGLVFQNDPATHRVRLEVEGYQRP